MDHMVQARIFDWMADTYTQQTVVVSRQRYLPWLEATARVVLQHHPRALLDGGCGPGTLLAMIAGHDPTITLNGVDLSARMLEHAGRRVPHARLHHEEFAQFAQHTPKGVDLVTLTFMLREQDDLDACLQAAHACLKPGGHIVVLETHQPDSPWGLAYPWYFRGLSWYARRRLTSHWPEAWGDAPYVWLDRTQRTWGHGHQLEPALNRVGFEAVCHHRPPGDVVMLVSALKA